MFSLYIFQTLTCHILNVDGDSESRRKLGGALCIYWLPSGSFNTKKSLILTLFNPVSLPPCPHITHNLERGILVFLYYCWKSLGSCSPGNGYSQCRCSPTHRFGVFKIEKERHGRVYFSKYTFMNQTTILMWVFFLYNPGSNPCKSSEKLPPNSKGITKCSEGI